MVNSTHGLTLNPATSAQRLLGMLALPS